MSGPIVNLGIVAGMLVSLGASAVGAQQVKVSVNAVPNTISAGTCARIWADVRNEKDQQLTFENGQPLQWGSYDYSSTNGTDFEWKANPSEKASASGEYELCAKPGVGAASTEVTATIKGMPHRGTAVLAVAPQPAGVAPGVASVSPPAAGPPPAASPPPAAGPPPVASPATVPAQPTYVPPVQPSSPPAQAASSPPTQAYAPPQTYAPSAPPAAAPPPPAAAPPPPQQAQAPPVKKGGGFFKQLGSHIKERAAEVKNQTSQNLTAAATQIVDTTFQTGSRLVASTTAEVTNTARLGIGGVGRQLMLAPQRAEASADNLTLAIASGRAVLLEMRFKPGTDTLEASAEALVQRLGAELRTAIATMATTTPGVRFEIGAHMELPSDQVMSENRAGKVKTLLSNQVDAKRLNAYGFGASQPLNGIPTARVEVVRCNDGQRACLMGGTQ